MANSCGAGELANTLLPSLIDGKSFDLPDFDPQSPDFDLPGSDAVLDQQVKSLTLADLTTGTIDGTGIFDGIMRSAAAHLKLQHERGLITGDQYTKAYIEIIATVLGSAVQYTLGKDQAYWQAVMVQQQARRAAIEVVTAKVQLQTAKAEVMTARIGAINAEAEYGLTKMKIVSEDANYCNLLAQKEQIEAQTTHTTAQTEQVRYQTTQILPIQKLNLQEQAEAARAQTMDTRTTGEAVKGSIGKQKELHSQQITSFQRDAEVKAAKLFTDAWITQKTIDEGLIAPPGFQNASVDVILTRLKQNNNLT